MAIQQVTNLSSILFYSGTYSTTAAEYTEGRLYGSYINSLGYLTKTQDALSVWSDYKNVEFEETKPEYKKLGDIYTVANSYAAKTIEDYPIGNIGVIDNRYNANYSYEGDLNNLFTNANVIVQSDLKNFLLSLNNNIYNKQKYYSDNVEINSIKIGQVDFKWYPVGTVAYSIPHTYEAECTYTSDTLIGITIDTETGEETTYEYTYSYTYMGTVTYDEQYIIGGDYYSYTRNTYNTIDSTLASNIMSSLYAFEEKYSYNASMYAYYMYDCNADLNVTFNSYSIGTKKSTLMINFDSKYNKWFDYNIALHANIEAGKPILTVSSAKDNSIFSIRLNENTVISGSNVKLDLNENHTFIADNDITDTDIISVLTPYDLSILDLSHIKDKLIGEINLNESKWNTVKGYSLKEFILGNNDLSTYCNVTEISGLNDLLTLEKINISNCNKLSHTPAISKLTNLKYFNAEGSNILTFKPAEGISLTNVILPDTLKVLKLVNNTITENGFKYIPTSTLSSVTLNNVKGINTYDFVYSWYTKLKTDDKLNSVIYLDLTEFNWNNVPVPFILGIRKFDINQLKGIVKLKGTGNWKYLTRTEYQLILKEYGLNAFSLGNDLSLLTYGIETFEYHNWSIKNENIIINDDEDESSKKIQFTDTLSVEFENNRASNSFLDILNSDTITFTQDAVENYTYYTLPNSIDTEDSEYINKIEAGDIMLYNGNTIVIFYKSFSNVVYNYVKIGHITDIEMTDEEDWSKYSTIEYMFNTSTSKVKFIAPTRPIVVEEINLNILTGSSTFTDIDDKFTFSVELDKPTATDKSYTLQYNTELITIDETDGIYTVKPKDVPDNTNNSTIIKVVLDAYSGVYSEIIVNIIGKVVTTTTIEYTTTIESTTIEPSITTSAIPDESYDNSEDNSDDNSDDISYDNSDDRSYDDEFDDSSYDDSNDVINIVKTVLYDEPIEIDIPNNVKYINYSNKLVMSNDKLVGAISEKGKHYINFIDDQNQKYIITIIVKDI